MIEKVKTKEELLRELKKYKSILNSEKYDYINSLIELEFSALRRYITDDEKNILSNLNIYRESVIYNIYYRTYNILSRFDKISKVGNDSNSQNLNAYLNGIHIFEFNYNSLKMIDRDKIASIMIYNSYFNEELRDKEIERVINKIDDLKSKNNPFSLKSQTLQAYNWNYTHDNEIKKYEKLLDVYSSFKEPKEDDIKRINLINEVNIELLNDFEITFDLNDEVINMTKSKMEKEYIKKLPDANVKNIIKYI